MSWYARSCGLTSGWFRDKSGYLTTTKLLDEKLGYILEFEDLLDPGETIATATWEMSGPTLESSALAGSTVTVVISGAGTAVLTLTTNTHIRQEKFRWVGLDGEVTDYV